MKTKHTQFKTTQNKRFDLLNPLLSVLLLLLATPLPAVEGADLCGCADRTDSLGDYIQGSNLPPGSTQSGTYGENVYIPLPDDGVLVFDSVHVRNVYYNTETMRFTRNAANTPVTLLVKGDVIIDSGTEIDIRGGNGQTASTTEPAKGGGPGAGGYRGGDGGSVDFKGVNSGGEGLGPGGGAPGQAGATSQHGANTSNPNLLPLLGGSGGGGGFSSASGNCHGGGGGAGGGAILIVANGTITINGNIVVDGGNYGDGSGCGGRGGWGSGGSIRLVAAKVDGGGGVYARGGRGDGDNDGKIRIETFNDRLSYTANPAALHTTTIGPIVNPIASTVAIVAVDGEPVPQLPTGSYGGIDLLLPAPGLISLQIETMGVPAGTTVDVAVKPDVGGPALHNEVTLELANCDDIGVCTVFTTFDLNSGSYFAEATATFTTPGS